MTWLNIDKACAADVLFLDMVWTDDESLSDFVVGRRSRPESARHHKQ